MSQLVEKKIGPLNCLTSDFKSDRKTVLVCHGYGASKEDLAGLVPYIKDKEKFNWVFPDAPMEIPIAPMMMGRAWFPITNEVLEQAMVQGKDSVYQNLVPEGMEEAIDKLVELINDLGVAPKDLILAGFSQGSMILTHLALRKLPESVAGLALLSSTLIAEQLLEKNDFTLNILQTHGKQDQILPFNGSKMLEGKLASLGHQVDFLEFRGGHEIPMEALNSFNKYLSSRA